MSFKVKDHFFKKAKQDNYLARSIYKLEEIDKKFKIINKSDQVIDLGYHPGSWIQYTSKKIGDNGNVYGIDIRPLNEKLNLIHNVTVFEKDIFDIHDISDLELEEKADVVLSDMAPNTTGIKSVDQDRSFALVEKVYEVLPIFLKNGGNFVIKAFDGHEIQKFLKDKKGMFTQVNNLRPKSTRSVSKEFFIIGRGFKG